MPSTPPQRARPASDLAGALLDVKGAGRKAFLQAAEKLCLPAKDLVDPRRPSRSLNEKLFPFHYPFMERAASLSGYYA